MCCMSDPPATLGSILDGQLVVSSDAAEPGGTDGTCDENMLALSCWAADDPIERER